jgi:hypothetical protein
MALHLESKSTAYTPKSAGSALVIGKIVHVFTAQSCSESMAVVILEMYEQKLD